MFVFREKMDVGLMMWSSLNAQSPGPGFDSQYHIKPGIDSIASSCSQGQPRLHDCLKLQNQQMALLSGARVLSLEMSLLPGHSSDQALTSLERWLTTVSNSNIREPNVFF